MLAGVPTFGRNVDATAKSECIVDHDDFLMVGCAVGMSAVELEMYSAAGDPVEDGERRGTANNRLESAQVPLQNVDVQVRSRLVDPTEEGTECVWPFQRLGFRFELDPGVEVPADEIDGVPCGEDGLFDRFEIIGGVND